MMVITGTVRQGQRRGKEVGARTANLDASLAKNLTTGLYLAKVTRAGQTGDGLLYYGINSLTGKICLEVYLADFDGDLYGQTITVAVGRHLREARTFATVGQLADQIKKDLERFEKLRRH